MNIRTILYKISTSLVIKIPFFYIYLCFPRTSADKNKCSVNDSLSSKMYIYRESGKLINNDIPFHRQTLLFKWKINRNKSVCGLQFPHFHRFLRHLSWSARVGSLLEDSKNDFSDSKLYFLCGQSKRCPIWTFRG